MDLGTRTMHSSVQVDDAEATDALIPALASVLAAGPTHRAVVGCVGVPGPGSAGTPAPDKVVAALVASGAACARAVWIRHGYVLHGSADPTSTA